MVDWRVFFLMNTVCIGSLMRYVELLFYLSLSKHFVYLVSVQVAPINTYAPSPQGYICVNHNTLYVMLQPCPVRGYTALRRNL